MSTKLTALLAVILSTTLLLPAPAAAQSGAVRPGQNKVPIRIITDDVKQAQPTEKTAPTGQTRPPAARKGNSLSPDAKIIIVIAAITAMTVVAIAKRKKRVCGPLSGCPLF